jgi:formiminotetrahydrofolate cyclodeaminase
VNSDSDRPLLACSVTDFLDRLASATPTPGGGSVAALVGSLAAGLGQMAVQYTVGRPKFASVEARVRELGDRLHHADHLLRSMVAEDAAAYMNLMAAFQMPKDSPDRPAAIQAAASLAARVPLQTAVLSKRVRLDLKALAAIANPNLRSDVEAGLHLASAAIAAAVANTRVNLPHVEPKEAGEIEAELAGLVADAK